MIRLSIVIPMYNVEPYVEKCLRSLEDQDIPKEDYEIICINDGSPDESKSVVKRLQLEFNNIFLIDQENFGVSVARNNGIDRVKGRYLLFVDPDDYVDRNSLNRILTTAEEQDAHISFLGFTFLKKDSSIHRRIFYEDLKSKSYLGLDAYKLSRMDGQTDPDRIWAILFKTEFLNQNKLRFLPGVPYLEDGEFITRILCLAVRCIFDGTSFYQRTTRPGSATNSKLSYTVKATNGFLLSASNLKKFQKEENLNSKQKEFLNQPICKFVHLALYSVSNNYSEFRKVNRKLKLADLGKCALTGCNNFYKIEGALYNISSNLFLLHRKLGTPLLKLVNP